MDHEAGRSEEELRVGQVSLGMRRRVRAAFPDVPDDAYDLARDIACVPL
jgi:hypothetical protein